MSLTIWLLFALTVVLDVWGQTAFKLGLVRISTNASGAVFWQGVALNPWIITGIAGYAAEAFCWMYVLGHAPLSVVGPMAALAYVGAVLAGVGRDSYETEFERGLSPDIEHHRECEQEPNRQAHSPILRPRPSAACSIAIRSTSSDS